MAPRSPSTRAPRRLAGALGALTALGVLAASPALAQSDRGLDVEALERQLREVADHATPRTVLVRVHVGADRQGAGSGAIISPDGYILTCTHVVELGERIEVVTSDGTAYDARVLGLNERQDYALVKIDAQDLPAFTIGDSDTLQPGQWVAALGHPGGPYGDLKPAFAAGKVISLHRKLPVGFMSKYYSDAVMTDCPIFAGDSGGPLVNMKGELVGINGAIVLINDKAFAVPINQIMVDLDALKQGTRLPGVPPGPEAFAEMQKIVSPEDYQRMMNRAFQKFMGEDSPLSGLFGEESPFKDLLGEDSPFRELFGGGNGEMPDLGELFGGGGGNGEMPDLGQLFGPDSPFGELFGGGGGGNGEMPDLGQLFGPDSPFGELFGGGGNGEMPDLGQLFGGDVPPEMQDMLEQLFGGGRRPEQPQRPAQPAPQAPAPRAFMGVQLEAAPGGGLRVGQLQPGGPAEQAGLQPGDVVEQVDGVATTGPQPLLDLLAGKRPGERVRVTLRRQLLDERGVATDRRLELDLTLGSN